MYANGGPADSDTLRNEVLVLEAQKTLLEERIIYLRQALTQGSGSGLAKGRDALCSSGAGTTPGGGAGKRPASGPPAGDRAKGAKRPRSHHGGGDTGGGRREPKAEVLFAKVKKILANLRKQSAAQPFLKPVDPVALRCLDYFDHIKKPMDLKKIGAKLGGRAAPRLYASPLEFREDVRQVFENCRLYNPVGHLVRAHGDRLSKHFEKLWAESGIEADWEALAESEKAALAGAALGAQQPLQNGSAPSKGPEVLHKVDTCGRELEELTAELAAGGGTAPAAQDNEDTAFPFILARQLSKRLEGAKGDGEPYSSMDILDILASSEFVKSKGGSDKPADCDINLLGNRTLWRLQRMVKLAHTASSDDGDVGPSAPTAPAAEAASQPANGKEPSPSPGVDEQPRTIPSAGGADPDPAPSHKDEPMPDASLNDNRSQGSDVSSREKMSPGSNPPPDADPLLDANPSQQASALGSGSPSQGSDGGGSGG